ncbi:hypothetical protein [Liquorilactobacillus hordei]|uniref:hypothetical protein n=1 Tax=Liquorilactobacillus hordei TaxID=468911 RepID=UPI0039E94352
MKNIMLVSLSILFLSFIFLSGCSKNNIASGKVKTEKYEILHTNVDHDGIFTLIPIVTSNGKTTTTILIPMWNQIDTLKITYIKSGKIRHIQTEDFYIEKTARRPYFKVKKGNLKNGASIVAWMKDKN